MNHRQDIDSRIDASLAGHVRAPRLDRQFDAAVWRRIEAERQQSARRSPTPVGEAGAARWLRVWNAAGVMVAAVLLVYFGMQQGGSVASAALTGISWELPQSWLSATSWAVAACALAFGLRLTPLGRWARAQFL